VGKAHQPSHARPRAREDRKAEFQLIAGRHQKRHRQQSVIVEHRRAVACLAHPQQRAAHKSARPGRLQAIGQRRRSRKLQTSHTLKSRLGPASSRFLRWLKRFDTLAGREFLAASPMTEASPR